MGDYTDLVSGKELYTLLNYWRNMNNPFYAKIRDALNNPGLQIALDANAERRFLARQNAISSVDEDWELLRGRAHKVRQKVISNLDEYLEQFIQKIRQNGFIVHLAADGNQAADIVLEIAKRHDSKLIVKSKSMVSEEIHLNHTLEKEGLQVIETDLGEYIIQLRGEHPAHIITPAVHLSRSEVGRTFEEKLGLPYTDDIPTMTAAARKELRKIFLKADLGISGVNFGVVETGSLCMVTNEGNGRMVTTLPPVHIALMGLERLVPGMEDLALMLDLLPRSATGQKLSVYTSQIRSPRQKDELDGAQERHLIILDNGRKSVRNSTLKEALLCIRCGACLNACPVFREIGGHAYVSKQGQHSAYPGPIGSVISAGLFGQKDFGHLAQASSLCGACKEACPVDIDLPKLLLRVRAGGLEENTVKNPTGVPWVVVWFLRLFTWFAIDGKRYSTVLKLANLVSRTAAPRKNMLRLPAFTGWGISRDLPRPAAKSFRQLWASGDIFSEQKNQTSSKTTTEKPLAATPPSKSLAFEDDKSDPQPLLDIFTHELGEINATYSICKQSDLAENLLTYLREHEIDNLMTWKQDHLPDGLLEYLDQEGIFLDYGINASSKAGLTGCLAAIAKTGSIALTTGPGRPMTTSLLPEIHLVVVRGSQLVADPKSVLMHPEFSSASSAVLISGPSRTADIEMTLTVGVHGPRQIHVFLLIDR
jgi:L-lactate dehydrogenase complex protein LldF